MPSHHTLHQGGPTCKTRAIQTRLCQSRKQGNWIVGLILTFAPNLVTESLLLCSRYVAAGVKAPNNFLTRHPGVWRCASIILPDVPFRTLGTSYLLYLFVQTQPAACYLIGRGGGYGTSSSNRRLLLEGGDFNVTGYLATYLICPCCLFTTQHQSDTGQITTVYALEYTVWIIRGKFSSSAGGGGRYESANRRPNGTFGLVSILPLNSSINTFYFDHQ